jgi:sugar lactone lactonase YvrE
VRLLDRDGAERWRIDTMEGPLAALRAPGGWWVADARAGAVHFVNDAGTIIHSDSSFVRIIDLAAAGEIAVWVADREGAVVRVELHSGVTRRDSTAAEPVAICPAPGGGFWVADRAGEALIRVSAGGEVLARVDGRPGVVAVYADPVLPGGVWVVDRLRRSVALFDADGLARAEIAGLSSPASLAVSPDGGTLWIADPGLGRVVRFRRDGTELSRSEPLAYPASIAVAFAPAKP